MQSERQREASEYRAQGNEQYQTITPRADRDVTVLRADAQRKAEQIRGAGDAERTKIFADAYGQDKDFFAFWRSMQAYENAFRGSDTRFVIMPRQRLLPVFLEPVGFGAFVAAREVKRALTPPPRAMAREARPTGDRAARQPVRENL